MRYLRSLKTPDPQLAEEIRSQADYLEHNAARMRYPLFRRQKLFVGSGVIEAGCKTAIRSRQAIRQVLDHSRRQCHHCPPL